MFWASFVIGVAAFLAMTIGIELIAAIVGDGPPLVTEGLFVWFWELIHGDVSVTTSSRTKPVDFVSFTVSLHVICAVVWSTLVTFVAQLLFAKRDRL